MKKGIIRILIATATTFGLVSTASARYVQADPIGPTRDYSDPKLQVQIQQGLIPTSATLSGDPTGMLINKKPLNHPYAYVDGNPLTDLDPTGLANGPGVAIILNSPKHNICINDCVNPIRINWTSETGPTVTKVYSLDCLLQFGIGFKGALFAGGVAAGEYGPGIAARTATRLGAPTFGAYLGAAGTTVAEISSGPIGIGASVAGALKYLGHECECYKD